MTVGGAVGIKEALVGEEGRDQLGIFIVPYWQLGQASCVVVASQYSYFSSVIGTPSEAMRVKVALFPFFLMHCSGTLYVPDKLHRSCGRTKGWCWVCSSVWWAES